MTWVPRALLAASFGAGLVACSGGSADVPDAPDSWGAFAVGHRSFRAVDAERDDRSLLVDVWYPVDDEDAQDAPLAKYSLLGALGLDSEIAVDDQPVSARAGQTLLVFSHGYQGIRLQSTELLETLASHGFIVIAPEHTGNAQASPNDNFDEAAANRVPDVSFLIDMMFERSRDAADAFYGRIAEENVGVVGHSFGGMTAIGMAAGWAGAPADPRVAAIVPISAVIDGDLQSDEREGPNAGFTDEQLSSITVPAMLIGGTDDINVPIGNNELAFEQMTNAPSVYKVDVIGATHTHFAAICSIADVLIEAGLSEEDWPEALVEPYRTTCTPEVFSIEEATRLQSLYVVAFFKRHLLNQASYDQYLTAEFADTEPAITFYRRNDP